MKPCPYGMINPTKETCEKCGYRCTIKGLKKFIDRHTQIETKIERKKINARYHYVQRGK